MTTNHEAFQQAVRHHQAGRLAAAEQVYRQILTVEPGHAGALHLLGVIAFQSGRHDMALECIGRAIAIDPRQATFHCNLGEVHRAQGQVKLAQSCYEAALKLDPNLAAAHNNLGLALQTQAEFSAASAQFQEAIRIQPEYVDAHYNLSRVLLLQGDYERGWREYDWRLRIPGHPHQNLTVPHWNGRPIDRGTLFVYAEQGLGDTLQFIRYIPLVKERTANVVVQVSARLIPLLTQSGYGHLLPEGSPLPSCAAQTSMLSLPALWGTTAATIPAGVPYLSAKPDLIASWRTALAGVAGLKVGIAWQGNRAFYSDRFRSIPLAEYLPLAAVPGVRLISLQKTDGVDQIEPVADRFNFVPLGAELDTTSGTFMDTAALMMNLDLVITSDTAIAHLAGGLGVPVWVALSVAPDWRFLLERSDSPWYPTMRLFRQTRFNQWSDVFQRIAAALASYGQDSHTPVGNPS